MSQMAEKSATKLMSCHDAMVASYVLVPSPTGVCSPMSGIAMLDKTTRRVVGTARTESLRRDAGTLGHCTYPYCCLYLETQLT